MHFPTIAEADISPTIAEADDAPPDYMRIICTPGSVDVGGARIYVGAIHHLHGVDGMRAQLDTVRKYLPDFGLAAPCGFGRVPERPGRLLTEEGDDAPPDYMRIIVEDHQRAVDVLGEVLR